MLTYSVVLEGQMSGIYQEIWNADQLQNGVVAILSTDEVLRTRDLSK